MRIFKKTRLAYFEEIDDDPAISHAIGDGDWILTKPYGEDEFKNIPKEFRSRTDLASLTTKMRCRVTANFGRGSSQTIRLDSSKTLFAIYSMDKSLTIWYNPKLDYTIYYHDACRLVINDNIRRIFRWVEKNPEACVSDFLVDLEHPPKPI